MVTRICAGCGKKTDNVKAYVGDEQFPLCEKCWKDYAGAKINLQTLKQKVSENE